MKNLTKLCFATILFLIAGDLKAQLFYSDGYVITKAKQKIEGKIKQIDSQNIRIIDEYGDNHALSIDFVDNYSIEGFKFIKANLTVNGQTSLTYLKEILVGYVSLYEIPNGNHSAKFVIKKENGDFQVLTDENSQIELRKLVADGNDLPLIEKAAKASKANGNYSLGYISSVIKDYNFAIKPNQKIFVPKKHLKYSLGIIFGLSWNKITYDSYSNVNLSLNVYNPNGVLSTNTFTPFGFNFTLNPQKTFSYEIEPFYNESRGTSTFNITSSISNHTGLVSIEEKNITIPINLKFSFLQKPFVGYIKAGPQFFYEKYLEGNVQDLAYKGSNPLFSLSSRSAFGYNLGVGVEKQFGNLIGKIEYRYCYHVMQDGVSYVSNNVSNQIVLGVSIF